MKTLVFIGLLTVLVSCGGSKKAHRYFNENKKELAQLCKDRFPISERYVKGDTVRIIDTIVKHSKEVITIDCPDGTKVKCPPNEVKYITVTQTIRDTIIKIDTRDVTILQEENKELYRKIEKEVKWKNRLGILSLILSFLIIIGIVFRK